jgi:hypothetical protein
MLVHGFGALTDDEEVRAIPLPFRRPALLAGRDDRKRKAPIPGPF